ncbi:hypothetical protein PAXRUDRAFT_29486 [Paxillus rubicundulus Ve08.2h10]|uniref:BTB domain-containing protein n=1 Tax=Paxillus rubicundulus Ve08.2h10 TaxID=930991 RepID=A0A0D0DYJ9_9AGAM|nr:hypothetical protein PAXRUDRAFT_29486 [Paxillus rubicundulus Ve08.2h10]
MPSGGVNQMVKHPQYYIRDGNITFLAEGVLFRVHKFFFERESEFFRTSLAPSGEKKDDEASDTNPYKLDVKSEEFAQFLWVWYNPKYTYSRQGKNAWLTVLRLANRWSFPEVRQLAIRQLEDLQMQPVEKIDTYKKYNVDNDLLLPSYMALCRSPTLPSPSDGEVLTMETVLKLANARERSLLSAAASGCVSPTSASASDEVLERIVADLFGLTPRSNDTAVGTGGQAVNGPNTTSTITVREPEPNKRGHSTNATQNTRTVSGIQNSH